ncbi:hypothetical protein ABPG72_000740 [Tetrahymena utriculariae]
MSTENLIATLDSLSSKQYTCRLLEVGDYDKMYFQCLSNLTSSPQISREDFEREFQLQSKNEIINSVHIVIEEVEKKKIVAAGSVIIERNIVGNIGHIEGIVAAKGEQGKGWGSKIMQALNKIGLENLGCIKLALYCKPSNTAFYEKLGYVAEGDECMMRK